MADTILTLAEEHAIFQDLTISMLGLEEALQTEAGGFLLTENEERLLIDPGAYAAVRVSYPPVGAPAWDRSDNITFITVREIDNPYSRLRENKYFTAPGDDLNLNQKTGYTRVLMVLWVCYGPNSYENAVNIRDGIFLQDYRDVLSKRNIYLVPDIGAPRRAPEVWQNQWYERVDLTMYFNELVIREVLAPCINEANISVVLDEGGITEVIDVQVSP